MSIDSLHVTHANIPSRTVVVTDPQAIAEATQKDVATLKDIEREMALTAQYLEQAEAARHRMMALLNEIMPNRDTLSPDEYRAKVKVASSEAEKFRDLEAKAYGLAGKDGRSNTVDELTAELNKLQQRLSAGGLNPAQISDTNKRILIFEEALFVKTHGWQEEGNRQAFVKSKVAEWEKKAADLRHVLTQDGWTPENRKPLENQIQAFEAKVKEGKAFLRGQYAPMSIASPLF